MSCLKNKKYLFRIANLGLLTFLCVSVSPAHSGVAPDSVESEQQELQEDSESRSKFGEFFHNLFKSSEKDGPSKDQAEDAQAGIPLELEQKGEGALGHLLEQVPVRLGPSRPWQPTQFGDQKGALGYTKEAFIAPRGMKERVDFWRDIYAKYTTSQGVIHDSVYVDVIYDTVDFTAIAKDQTLSDRQKRKARESLIKEKRKVIEDRLRRLQGVTTAEGLTGEDLRYFKMFETVNNPRKFIEATENGRIRFQLGQKDRFYLGLYYSGRYLNRIEKIFQEEGVPLELTRLPFVESSYNLMARSKVGASGIWQFMRRTGKLFRMQINNQVDERNDPLRATRAAAKMLRQNYEMLESWPLAITGYNHGPAGVRNIVNHLGTKDIVEIVNKYSSARFGFASENFYACLLAAIEVEKNADKYFANPRWSVPLQSEEVKVTKPIAYSALLALFRGDEDLVELFNPHFLPSVRRGRQSIPTKTSIYVPPQVKDIASRFINGELKATDLNRMVAMAYPPEMRAAASNEPSLSAPSGEAAAKRSEVGATSSFKEASAETQEPAVLGTVTKAEISAEKKVVAPISAASAGTAATPSAETVLAGKNQSAAITASVAETPKASLLGVDKPTVAAEKTAPETAKDAAKDTAKDTAAKDTGEKDKAPTEISRPTKPKRYVVARGDNLEKISKNFGVEVSELKKINRLSRRGSIRAGQILMIPQ